MKPIHGDKLRGHLETLILSVLEPAEAHGLEILHRLDQAGCGLLHLKEGSLYRPCIVWRRRERFRQCGKKSRTGDVAPDAGSTD